MPVRVIFDYRGIADVSFSAVPEFKVITAYAFEVKGAGANVVIHYAVSLFRQIEAFETNVYVMFLHQQIRILLF